MKDRLGELQQRMRDTGEVPIEDSSTVEDVGILVAPQAVIFEAEPMLENFLSEVQQIREGIDDLDAEVKKFRQQQRTLVAAMRRFSIMKKESHITRDIKLLAEGLYKRLDGLSRQVKSSEAESGPQSALTRIQRAQHASLFHYFQRVMSEYNSSLISKQDKCKQFIIRQLEVSGREVLEAEVDNMMVQGHWEVFNENILHEAKITRMQLSEIEQHHRELVSLEGNMRDLRDLFLEVYLLVEEQGQHVESIQRNVENTQDYVAASNEKFKMAVRYKKRNPLRRLCCCCFCPWKICRKETPIKYRESHGFR